MVQIPYFQFDKFYLRHSMSGHIRTFKAIVCLPGYDVEIVVEEYEDDEAKGLHLATF